MGPESTLWGYFKKKIGEKDPKGTFSRFTRHEDSANIGTPDISYTIRGISGWIELKVIPSIPKDLNKPVYIPHLTSQQKRFLLKEWTVDGNPHILLRTLKPKNHFLFSREALVAVALFGKESRLTWKLVQKNCALGAEMDMLALWRQLKGDKVDAFSH